jgi:hypothetical protein
MQSIDGTQLSASREVVPAMRTAGRVEERSGPDQRVAGRVGSDSGRTRLQDRDFSRCSCSRDAALAGVAGVLAAIDLTTGAGAPEDSSA